MTGEGNTSASARNERLLFSQSMYPLSYPGSPIYVLKQRIILINYYDFYRGTEALLLFNNLISTGRFNERGGGGSVCMVLNRHFRSLFA
jgi:hypothetical protein